MNWKNNPMAENRGGKYRIIVPALFGLVVGSQHYIRESFVIYLKYQGLVDAYYHQKQDKIAKMKAEMAAAQVQQPQTA